MSMFAINTLLHPIFNYLLGVWKCGQTQSFMFITSKSLGLWCIKGADESLPRVDIISFDVT